MASIDQDQQKGILLYEVKAGKKQMKASYGASFQPQSIILRHIHTYTHTHTHTNSHKNHCHSEKLILYESVIYFKMEKIDIHCFSIILINPNVGCSGGSDGKKMCLQCGRPGFEP